MNYKLLVKTISQTHYNLQKSATKAINLALTIRNWLIGYYIVEFEQQGEDRAAYGAELINRLAESLNQDSMSYRNLNLFRQFYIAYDQISPTISAKLKLLGLDLSQNIIPLTEKALLSDNLNVEILQTPSAELSYKSMDIVDENLIIRLSFSHFSLLIQINDIIKRRFYENECIKGNWSVRELKRQINSLYFERSGMSRNFEKLHQIVQGKSEKIQVHDIIKSPFTFEFLGLKSSEVVYENDLEKALIDHLSEFLLELGNGFCFEAKQKRITIGDEYFFIDLVFYHRILKCHVLVELKTNEVKHEHIGQLKAYINYYKREIMPGDDNPPVGILLMTARNKALVEYTMADSDLSLFVSKYILELPRKEEFQRFINEELRKF